MENYIKVSGHSGLVRDPKTNSIINTNSSEYQEYLHKKQLKNEESKKIQNLESDLSTLKNDIEEIKNLLRGLSNGSK
jgi:hypothetical protein